MKRVIIFLVLLAMNFYGCLGTSVSSGHVELANSVQFLSLKSLDPACRLFKSWLGYAFYLPEGVLLDCGGRPMLATHPLNLYAKVHIVSEESALILLDFLAPMIHICFFPEMEILEGM